MKNDRYLPDFTYLRDDEIARRLGIERPKGLPEDAWRRIRQELLDNHPDVEALGNQIDTEWSTQLVEGQYVEPN